VLAILVDMHMTGYRLCTGRKVQRSPSIIKGLSDFANFNYNLIEDSDHSLIYEIIKSSLIPYI